MMAMVRKESVTTVSGLFKNPTSDMNGTNGTVHEVKESSDDEENVTNGNTKQHVHKKPVCEVCKEKESKYTCPGCSMKTCSLPCVKAHKAKSSCSGDRHKTEFVEMTVYSDQTLLNDYRFLEEAERTLYSNKHVPNNKQHRIQRNNISQHYSKRSKLLIAAALKRGVKLKILPPFLSKNKENTSYYTVKSDTIDWHMEWLFTTATTLRVKDEKVPETSLLVGAASKFTNGVEYPHLRKSLEEFPTDQMAKCQFLLKIEGLPANMQRYVLLNPESSIRDSLQGHCVTEYPSILVLPVDFDTKNYTMLSKEDMCFMTQENVSHVTRYRPDLSLKDQESMSKLLNPNSSLYTVDT